MEKLTNREFKNLIYSEIARVGKALADPKRLEILDLLSQAEKNVELLSQETGMSMASTSHHLQILKEAKLVGDRRVGKFIFYRIRESGKNAWKSVSRIADESITEIQYLVQNFFKDDSTKALEYRDLMDRISRDELVLLDVRPSLEYETEHIPGSISIPINELEEKMKNLPKNKPIFAYCRGKFCVLSYEAIRILNSNGFKAIRLEESVDDFKDKMS